MVDLVSITNRALQAVGTRTNVTSAELTNNTSNEAIQTNLIITTLRDEILRLAPWNCARNYVNLTYITSAPGTPENPTAGSTTWQKGTPAPPWLYEYQYPSDCLRALWVVPAGGPPIRFSIGIDQFYSATGVAVASGGTGHAVGDVLTLAAPASGLGAPAQVLVTTVAAGVITAASLVTNVFGTTLAGSYFTQPTNPVAQASSTGVGINATFNLTFPSPATKVDQRVILTNQPDATLAYIKRVTDPNIMDDDFIETWVLALGAKLCLPLSGDKQLMQFAIQRANAKIMEARKNDGNESLTVNDFIPDFLLVRGLAGGSWEHSPQVDWGPAWTP